jgi:hypothetical protein
VADSGESPRQRRAQSRAIFRPRRESALWQRDLAGRRRRR